MNKKFKKILVIVLIIIISLPLVGLITCDIVYRSILDTRFETQSILNFTIDDFENLKRDNYIYQNDNGNNLHGYLYYNDYMENINGLIIVVHGLGSGHRVYMEAINYFVNNDYYVFSYDSSGTDESEGKIKGLPQQLINLKYTIEFVGTIDSINDLPLFLFGHSWGGYAVSNILNFFDNIEAVVSVSGFNSSGDIILEYGKNYVSSFAYVGLPIVNLYEALRFGDYARSNAIEAFNNSEAKIMVVHSEDDNVVPIEVGFDKYFNKFKDNKRFKFIKYKNRGHSFVIYSEQAIKAIGDFNMKFDLWVETLKYDYTSEEYKEQFINDKEEFYNKNLDKNVLCNLIDKELFDEIIEFYNQSYK